MSLLLVPQNLPFLAALALVVAIALIELVGLLAGLHPGHALDSWVPDAMTAAPLDRLLGWLHVGRVPVLVLLLCFLTGFALVGLGLQMMAQGLLGKPMPAIVAAILAVGPGLATVRSVGALLAHIVPADESSAVTRASLIGRAGVISGGTARRGLAAQARVRDRYGRLHHLLVEPDADDDQLPDGTDVLIVRRSGAFYRAIRHPHASLL